MRALIALAGLVALAAVASQEEFRYDPADAVVEVRPLDRMAAGPPPDLVVQAASDGDSLLWRDGLVRGPLPCVGAAAVALQPSGGEPALVVWDELNGTVEDGASFDVLASWRIDGGFGPPVLVAGGPRLQVRPSVVLAPNGDAWVAWEEGADGWGHAYRSVDQRWNNASDARGPLHSWREVHVACVSQKGVVREVDVPMPSFERQRRETVRRPGTERLGVFYEAPALAFDTSGALWLAYRHMHQSQLSLRGKTTTHIERGYEVHLLRLDERGWSAPQRLSELQRDSDQRLVLSASEAGISVACEVGRQDRRGPSGLVGWVGATLPIEPRGSVELEGVAFGAARAELAGAVVEAVRTQPRADVGGARYTLLFGDLHRHTDLSLCFPFYDGSLETAYRYARGPAALDFFAVTDHARDLGRGDVRGPLWQRTVRAVDAHHRPGRFACFYAYERSQGDTDHNVIALRSDVLRPHTPPLTEFWSEFSADEVLTIPHATSGRDGARFSGDVWQKRDDARRPIAEIYQSYRDVSSMEELSTLALATGQKLGFIASSDHLATSSAYACVWAEGDGAECIERQPIFDALAARRTYGATARIELRVTSAGRWMGADLAGPGPHPIEVRARGSAPIERIEFWRQGLLAHVERGEGRRLVEATWEWTPGAADEHPFAFVRVVQRDGERAWSSPFFSQAAASSR